MIKKKVVILYDEQFDNLKKGEFFEGLISDIFYSQRYHISERVNFTGMEIDLIANHKDRINEKIYIECKARDNLSSTDIKSFVFNTKFKNVPYGYFLSTSEYVHQVAGLIEEIKANEDYSNLYFWGPQKIIELLEESKKISTIDYTKYKINVAKEILVKSFFGCYRVCVLVGETYAQHFCLFNAENNEVINDEEIIEMIQTHVPELQGLSYFRANMSDTQYEEVCKLDNDFAYETIAEVKKSENWYDYLPTSKKHFVGRKNIVALFNEYIEEVRLEKTDKRVFYIEGKSGWGKSSFVSYIRDKYSGKKYKKNYLVFAVDTRSANSNNFVSHAVKALFEKAIQEKFIQTSNELSIISNYDILESDSIKAILRELKETDKYVILVFDQFEDVFRKAGIFKAFYKLMLDINNAKENIILGFSWKSEINIPIDHEAYHLWQTVKNETKCFNVEEFNSKEVASVIGQMQKSISVPLELSVKRKITESSQGFPWLTKKLCIHIYNQINAGNSMESLVEQDLNIKGLFDTDLEKLEPKEVKALKYIAQRAYDGDMFDATEIDEVLENCVLTELINKRLVIKTGTKYNIYWDIFRDYLIKENIPMIGESYILRMSPVQCLKTFLAFKEKKYMTLQEMADLSGTKKNQNSTLNVLRELINLGFVYKRGDTYCTTCDSANINKNYFVTTVRKKFEHYTPIMKLKTYTNGFSTTQIIKELKKIFKGVDISQKTWEVYARILISWIYFAELNDENFYLKEISSSGEMIPRAKKVKNQAESFTPQKTITQDIAVFKLLVEDIDNVDTKRYNKNLYDLSAIGLLHYWGDTVIFTDEGLRLASALGKEEFERMLSGYALGSNKISMAVEIIRSNSIVNSRQFREQGEGLVENINSEIYKKHTLSKIYSWAQFVVQQLIN